MTIDVDALRNALLNYYGTAAFSGMPMALWDVSKVKKASPEELIQMALNNGFDLSRFSI